MTRMYQFCYKNTKEFLLFPTSEITCNYFILVSNR